MSGPLTCVTNNTVRHSGTIEIIPIDEGSCNGNFLWNGVAFENLEHFKVDLGIRVTEGLRHFSWHQPRGPGSDDQVGAINEGADVGQRPEIPFRIVPKRANRAETGSVGAREC